MPAPNHPLELKDEDPEELRLRTENIILASQQEDAESKKAETELLASETKTDMLRKIGAKEADRAMDAERQRRIAEEGLIHTQEEMLRKKGAQKAIRLEKEEQQRRILEETKAVAMSDAVRRQTQKTAVEEMEQERVRRQSAEDLNLVPESQRDLKRQVEQDVVQNFAAKHPSTPIAGTPSTYSYGPAPRSVSTVPRSSVGGDSDSNGIHNEVQEQQGGSLKVGSK
ncbi:hypothetical protein SpCBS45565_g00659 [Spizellomyces sp. 'palustris']|nr:hypothetical protein SpCBS45565_g00659 [Spizellomyces sp. 'palustris']